MERVLLEVVAELLEVEDEDGEHACAPDGMCGALGLLVVDGVEEADLLEDLDVHGQVEEEVEQVRGERGEGLDRLLELHLLDVPDHDEALPEVEESPGDVHLSCKYARRRAYGRSRSCSGWSARTRRRASRSGAASIACPCCPRRAAI